MKIFGASGQNLICCNGIISANKVTNRFFNQNDDELLQRIRYYEAISFDLFDTLIMRKCLEASDLFDLLEKPVKEKGILVQN